MTLALGSQPWLRRNKRKWLRIKASEAPKYNFHFEKKACENVKGFPKTSKCTITFGNVKSWTMKCPTTLEQALRDQTFSKLGLIYTIGRTTNSLILYWGHTWKKKIHSGSYGQEKNYESNYRSDFQLLFWLFESPNQFQITISLYCWKDFIQNYKI